MADMDPLANILNGTAADASDVQANFQTLETYINGVNLVRTDGTEVMTADLNLDGNTLANISGLDMNATKITDLADGTVDADAINLGQLNSAISGGVPSGVLTMYGGAAAPTGWLLCDGTVVLKATYPDLFIAIDTAFNTGGETASEFRLPNFQDRYPIGDSGTLTLGGAVGSNDAVAVAHTHTFVHDHPDNLAAPAHNHNMPNAAIESFGNTGLANRFVTATSWPGFAGNGETGAASATALTGSVSNNPGTDVTAGQAPTSTGTNTNRPSSVVVNYIIKT